MLIIIVTFLVMIIGYSLPRPCLTIRTAPTAIHIEDRIPWSIVPAPPYRPHVVMVPAHSLVT
jgi:hypothetical protein